MIKIRECCGNQKEGDISRRPVIINHDLRGCSTEEELDKVSGLDAYSGRVLGISHREDIIQFSPILKPNYDWVRDHFRRIGLKCSENIIWDKDFDVLKDYGDYDFSVFYFGEKIHGIRPDEKWFSIADRMNEKNFFIKKSRELGLPTPKTFLFNSVEEINDLHVFPFPCYFKLSRSVSGMGVHKCAHFLELAEQLAKIKPGVRFQIQEKADSDCFISSQYRVTGGQLYFVATTAQILKGDVHKGNYGPIEYDPRNVTDVLAQYMFECGMKGHFGIDMVVVKDNYDNNQYQLLECNPRFTGASYPFFIAQRLGAKFWHGRGYDVDFTNLNDWNFDRSLEYDPKRKSGLVVFNWGCAINGTIGILIVAQEKDEIEYYKKAIQKMI
ncbi:hypothetical protein A2331_01085 [Candidatus Falkowbacteria bacterium RIFOXYB2_FULL_34_18]|uniref:ATP-grasp domain-containing protein n=1 Tax=Candidatus Falkowbacteria bacterium RIFOXYD2_FULL_34_120 TaxID=1798007 RepID=A0A1F5TSX1_9BACT|nr:MAG: hypothetical protein A2331_01085 [Candidatus Falkowbacteria bacterium RIFOXYB2_FULL_34_18]OGF30159.1 MAG: hypothetical protein A2500_02025 [Candidatus Falkowbacteria bacterium RIFOXYC12_FULL_34_55]OGF37705.1 MAG: hypothetical protein A2466_01715 [Candidatus Falkowbacteria bacterium RIFOXYC2_FULL_34_220]OGF39419.1 MAG: hypothetical protein A2515_02870 [Candidatus Falkowbacteria bacterium RIFOXYD12_FULL_34_57]OGF41884.1 MAG: hypothetical protein A2531_00805 [Candidatus Falkowbacteria bact